MVRCAFRNGYGASGALSCKVGHTPVTAAKALMVPSYPPRPMFTLRQVTTSSIAKSRPAASPRGIPRITAKAQSLGGARFQPANTRLSSHDESTHCAAMDQVPEENKLLRDQHGILAARWAGQCRRRANVFRPIPAKAWTANGRGRTPNLRHVNRESWPPRARHADPDVGAGRGDKVDAASSSSISTRLCRLLFFFIPFTSSGSSWG
jgi:hypothetical protein